MQKSSNGLSYNARCINIILYYVKRNAQTHDNNYTTQFSFLKRIYLSIYIMLYYIGYSTSYDYCTTLHQVHTHILLLRSGALRHTFFIYIGIGPFEVDTHTYFEHIGISIYIMIIKNRYENVSFNSFIDIIIIIKRRLILNRYNDRHFVYIYI